MTRYWCEHALLGDRVESGVLVEMEGGRFTGVSPSSQPGDAHRLRGLTIPGLSNCHSHAFHRALRTRVQQGSGTFWTWRQQMYALAGRLDPDSYHALATAVYSEMAAAGITSVGEFHYLHHPPGGGRYADPNAMGAALIAAAAAVGIRIALLDACYLTAGIGQPAEGVQRRFDDGSAEAWRARVEALLVSAGPAVVVGGAVHSVRAVPQGQIPTVARFAADHGAPLHAHVSEQPAENTHCIDAYGKTPTEVLLDAGALSHRSSAVHATHVTPRDIGLLGDAHVNACFCPTTERDLGDGIGPGPALMTAGCRLTLGSDSHAVVDPFDEMRALEMDERLASGSRGHWSAVELLYAASEAGHASLGFADAGRIEVGSRADLVTLDLTSPRTAGGGPTIETAVFAASAADVTHVICDGRAISSGADAREVGDRLDAAIRRAWGDS